ncbi:hypothetical protein QBC46DRAFT_31764 [Diplogelasinospora grovesii]|uniref:Uncharacterized protein n=1 Tax=Diplogelasinospora grovesii TaxID=303347 RepID=A0AAN6S1H8_9PEZI|nr:hypothetical protein QBC46DRAFT_31764 [Diplogelasinospora grovesii]
MSGIEAFSLVCGIFQVISFAHETITLCKAIYQGASPDEHLQKKAVSLADVSANVQARQQGMTLQTADERSLADIARKCNIAARALQDEARFISNHQKSGSLVATMHVAAKTSWRKRRLERL